MLSPRIEPRVWVELQPQPQLQSCPDSAICIQYLFECDTPLGDAMPIDRQGPPTLQGSLALRILRVQNLERQPPLHFPHMLQATLTRPPVDEGGWQTKS
jgi:hypothetical protein